VSTLTDALRGVRDLLLLQAQVKNLEKAVEGQGDLMRQMARDLIDVDKRLSHVEGMIRGAAIVSGQPRIEG
jgi:hypothetical protein